MKMTPKSRLSRPFGQIGSTMGGRRAIGPAEFADMLSNPKFRRAVSMAVEHGDNHIDKETGKRTCGALEAVTRNSNASTIHAREEMQASRFRRKMAEYIKQEATTNEKVAEAKEKRSEMLRNELGACGDQVQCVWDNGKK